MYLIKRVIFTIGFIGLMAISASAQSAEEIVRQAYEKMEGESSRAEITMKIVRPNWDRSVSMKSWSLGEDYSLILITAPARDEGTSFLMRNNEIWNWLPDVNRTIKMPPSMMSQSWMGSDFSNNDLVRESSVITDYTYSLLEDETVDGYDCYKIEMIPKPDAPIVWDRVVSFISKDEYLNLRVEYYDEDDEMVRVMTGSEVEQLGGRLLPTRMEMIPVEDEGNRTIITYQDIEFDIDISERFFSIQNMKRVQ
ncbi:outer membrane lipoprotein-sorting protein [Rhodohalobacter sulfatireducens]|uniref:Outer membrane lipoprotein-sorting protein n=1 Tax=Rhodohalobacter sulfatireducens TaxID=2911366 RepID=A0ABS9KFE1_9BACT|nr:outer membrane lipoprotein-sorting protein [Rhodohalobacter sulfatireducens]MCG2589573.1 outer membrane lipoprotein-sorting protein [Rhodohalobacter sulfatireducens]